MHTTYLEIQPSSMKTGKSKVTFTIPLQKNEERTMQNSVKEKNVKHPSQEKKIASSKKVNNVNKELFIENAKDQDLELCFKNMKTNNTILNATEAIEKQIQNHSALKTDTTKVYFTNNETTNVGQKEKEIQDKQIDGKFTHGEKTEYNKSRKPIRRKLNVHSACLQKDTVSDFKLKKVKGCTKMKTQEDLDLLYSKKNFETSDSYLIGQKHANKHYNQYRFNNNMIHIKDFFSFQEFDLKKHQSVDLKSTTSTVSHFPSMYSSSTDIDGIIKRNLDNLINTCTNTTQNPKCIQERKINLQMIPNTHKKQSEIICQNNSQVFTDHLQLNPISNTSFKSFSNSDESLKNKKIPPHLPPIDFEVDVQLCK